MKQISSAKIVSNPKASTKKIIGGVDAVPGEFPFFAEIYIRNSSNGSLKYCNGVLLDHEWILTVKHCAYQNSGKYSFNASDYVGYVFLNMINMDDVSWRKVYVRGVFPYDRPKIKAAAKANPTDSDYEKDFKTWIKNNDIMLLMIDPVPEEILSNNLLPKLPTENLYFVGQNVIQVGFGGLTSVTPLTPGVSPPYPTDKVRLTNSNRLQKLVNIPIQKISGDFFGYGFNNFQKDLTQTPSLGDSGGPVLYKKADHDYYLLGLFSNGGAGFDAKRPNSYATNVFKYLNWIKKTQYRPDVMKGY